MTNISHCGQTLGATEEIGLRLDSLSTGYGHCKVGNSLNAEAKKGEITCLLGPNGCGKSTLIKTLMGILPPLGGRIGLNGEDFLQCPAPKRALVCSVVLTEQLFPDYLRVEELVWLGRFPHRSAWQKKSREDGLRVNEALVQTESEHLIHRWVHTLSDGERQRVVLARALAQDPQILILDEPTTHLDVPHKAMTFKLLQQWVRDKNRMVLMSTHDLEMSLAFADQIWLMGLQKNDGRPDGSLSSLKSGSPEDLLLSGELQKVFSHAGMELNQNGQLSFLQESSINIGLECPASIKFLAHKSLLRWGYSAVEKREGLPWLSYGESVWTLGIGDQRVSFSNLLDCCRYLRQHEPKPTV